MGMQWESATIPVAVCPLYEDNRQCHWTQDRFGQVLLNVWEDRVILRTKSEDLPLL